MNSLPENLIEEIQNEIELMNSVYGVDDRCTWNFNENEVTLILLLKNTEFELDEPLKYSFQDTLNIELLLEIKLNAKQSPTESSPKLFVKKTEKSKKYIEWFFQKHRSTLEKTLNKEMKSFVSNPENEGDSVIFNVVEKCKEYVVDVKTKKLEKLKREDRIVKITISENDEDQQEIIEQKYVQFSNTNNLIPEEKPFEKELRLKTQNNSGKNEWKKKQEKKWQEMEEIAPKLKRLSFDEIKLEICQFLWTQRSKKQYLDIKFIVGDKNIYAHKCILAARSEYFEELFRAIDANTFSDEQGENMNIIVQVPQSPTSPTTAYDLPGSVQSAINMNMNDANMLTIRIKGYKPSIVEELLDYIYRGRIEVWGEEKIDSYLMLAKDWKIRKEIKMIHRCKNKYSKKFVAQIQEKIRSSFLHLIDEKFGKLTADLTVFCGLENKLLPAHKVFCTRSVFIQKCLNSGMIEQLESKLIFNSISSAGIKQFLEFIYTGSVKVQEETAVELSIFSLLFKLPKLTDACVSLILEWIEPDNAVVLLKLFHPYKEEKIIKKCVTCIVKGILLGELEESKVYEGIVDQDCMNDLKLKICTSKLDLLKRKAKLRFKKDRTRQIDRANKKRLKKLAERMTFSIPSITNIYIKNK